MFLGNILSLFFLSILCVLSLNCTDNAFMLGSGSQGLNYNPLFNSKVDILLVIDNSGSMDKHQAYLAASAQNFIKRLASLEFDFQIGVTSTDISANGHKGKLIGTPAIINSKTPSPENKLHERLLLGTDGSSVEEGLEAINMALDPNNETNFGFIRADAFLLVVVLSNENDSGTSPTTHYIELLNRVKPALPGRERGWMMNFIGVTGQAAEDCKTFGDYKDVGTRYLELVTSSGGFSNTICTADLSSAVKGVEKALLTLLTEIILSRLPQAETIKVLFNNQIVPNEIVNGWTYNAVKNSVLFHGIYIPQVKTKIEIIFDPINPK